MSAAFNAACADAYRLQAQQYRAEARAARLNPWYTPELREKQSSHYEALADRYADLAIETEAA